MHIPGVTTNRKKITNSISNVQYICSFRDPLGTISPTDKRGLYCFTQSFIYGIPNEVHTQKLVPLSTERFHCLTILMCRIDVSIHFSFSRKFSSPITPQAVLRKFSNLLYFFYFILFPRAQTRNSTVFDSI